LNEKFRNLKKSFIKRKEKKRKRKKEEKEKRKKKKKKKERKMKMKINPTHYPCNCFNSPISLSFALN